MTKIIPMLCLLLLSFENMAQLTHASISQREMTIGERVTLSYSLPIKGGKSVDFEPYITYIPASKLDNSGKNKNAANETVEILLPFRDTIITSEGGPVWTGYYEITVWDSGVFTLPGPIVKMGQEKLQFPSVNFTSKLSPSINGIETYDIKESFADIPDQTIREKLNALFSRFWWVLVFLLAVIIGWIWITRKKRNQFEEQNELSSYERTLRGLKQLELKEIWKSGKVKAHYTELSWLLKNYLTDIYVLNLRERTSAETLLLMEHKVQSRDVLEMIKKVLETSDLVKFAKFHPQEHEVRNHLKECTQLITLIHEQTSTYHE